MRQEEALIAESGVKVHMMEKTLNREKRNLEVRKGEIVSSVEEMERQMMFIAEEREAMEIQRTEIESSRHL